MKRFYYIFFFWRFEQQIRYAIHAPKTIHKYKMHSRLVNNLRFFVLYNVRFRLKFLQFPSRMIPFKYLWSSSILTTLIASQIYCVLVEMRAKWKSYNLTFCFKNFCVFAYVKVMENPQFSRNDEQRDIRCFWMANFHSLQIGESKMQFQILIMCIDQVTEFIQNIKGHCIAIN